MRLRERYGRFCLLCGKVLCLLALLPTTALAAQPPYEFDATLSLIGGCVTPKKTDPDQVPDPGCPEKKPSKLFHMPSAIAFDSFGDEYVTNFGAEEGKQGVVDIFSPKGVFIAEVQDELGPKSVAIDSEGTLYTFDQSPGHEAEFGRYKPTSYEPAKEEIAYGPRELIATDPGPSEGGIAVDGKDHVLVDWSGSIKEYGPAKEENELLDTITNKRLYSSTFLALDKERKRLYASSCPDGDITKCWVLVFNAENPHELLEEIKGPGSESSFASQKGWISIAVDEETGDFFVGDLEATKNVYQFNEGYEPISTLAINPELFEGGAPLQIAVSNAGAAFNHEDLFVPANTPKNRALAFDPPHECAPEIEGIGAADIAETEGDLQAQIEPCGGITAYRFEYLSQQEYEEGGNSFTGAKVAGEGTVLPAEQGAEVSAPLGSLQPGTSYRFRIFAENGVGGTEAQASFATYDDAPVSSICENQSLRIAYSAPLPDCRAYELVTPADTGGQLPTGANTAGEVFPSVKASPDGDVISFLTEGGTIPGFEGTGSANGDLYRTVRTQHGWSTESAGPNGEQTTAADEGSTSPDQGYSFWSANREGSAVIGGEITRYVRYPDGHSELIGRGDFGTDPRARGKLITENGTHIIFTAGGIYDRTADEVTHIISQLPNNPEVAVVGEYLGSSTDGEGVAFMHGSKLYLRAHNNTTYEIGESVEFASISEGGARIFYVEGGNLLAFDIETEKTTPFTEVGNAVPVNVSADGTRAYFVSTTAIGGSGESPNGAVAKAGAENLYLSEEGTIRFVGTVTKRDVEGESNPSFVTRVDGLGLWNAATSGGGPAIDPSQTSTDGSVLLFSSRANLDGYAHEGVPELYRYDSAGDSLHCISCIPTKAPATDGANLQSLFPAEVTAPLGTSGFVPNLRADGKRAIFQSTEALVSRDNDGVEDIYEWEENEVGSCTRPGGCVYLLSSGSSSKNNYLYGISNSGNDVFFTTNDILVGGDNDTLSIYDARVEGGFPEEKKLPCRESGECPNSPTPPPLFPSLESEGLPAPPHPSPKPCPKGQHKVKRDGKQVCVKNKKHHRKHNKTKKGAGK